MRIGCLLGHHKRASRSVRDAGDHYAAVCKDCGKPLIRNHRGRWVVGTSAGEAPTIRGTDPTQSGKTPISAIESNRGDPVKDDRGNLPTG